MRCHAIKPFPTYEPSRHILVPAGSHMAGLNVLWCAAHRRCCKWMTARLQPMTCWRLCWAVRLEDHRPDWLCHASVCRAHYAGPMVCLAKVWSLLLHIRLTWNDYMLIIIFTAALPAIRQGKLLPLHAP